MFKFNKKIIRIIDNRKSTISKKEIIEYNNQTISRMNSPIKEYSSIFDVVKCGNQVSKSQQNTFSFRGIVDEI